jgi:hypothetical protein
MHRTNTLNVPLILVVLLLMVQIITAYEAGASLHLSAARHFYDGNDSQESFHKAWGGSSFLCWRPWGKSIVYAEVGYLQKGSHHASIAEAGLDPAGRIVQTGVVEVFTNSEYVSAAAGPAIRAEMETMSLQVSIEPRLDFLIKSSYHFDDDASDNTSNHSRLVLGANLRPAVIYYPAKTMFVMLAFPLLLDITESEYEWYSETGSTPMGYKYRNFAATLQFAVGGVF